MKKLKIIVIDDEECIRDPLKWHLEGLGHECLSASEPALCDVYHGHACSQISACADALLIDYNLPGMNGLEFIERLKSRGCKGVISSMLIMSGNTTEIDMAKAAEFGSQIFQKPFRFEELERWLEDVEKRIAQQTSGSMNKHIVAEQ